MRFLPSSIRRRPGRTLFGLSAVCGAALLAGCGGSGGGSNGSGAEIRAVDTLSNGGSATISVGGNSIANGQSYFSASAYQSVSNGSALLTFSLSSNHNTPFPSVTQTLSLSGFYSAILVGRSDVTAATDPRYPTLLVTSDSISTPATGQASLRVVNTAPDAGSVDVLVNGAVLTAGTAYKGVTSYVTAPTGTLSVQVNAAGTTTPLTGVQTLNLTAGHVYTIFVVEPTVTPTPVYGLQEADDTAAAGG